MYGRIMRLVIPLIMGMFLIIGLVLLWAIQANGQETLSANAAGRGRRHRWRD